MFHGTLYSKWSFLETWYSTTLQQETEVSDSYSTAVSHHTSARGSDWDRSLLNPAEAPFSLPAASEHSVLVLPPIPHWKIRSRLAACSTDSPKHVDSCPVEGWINVERQRGKEIGWGRVCILREPSSATRVGQREPLPLAQLEKRCKKRIKVQVLFR